MKLKWAFSKKFWFTKRKGSLTVVLCRHSLKLSGHVSLAINATAGQSGYGFDKVNRVNILST